MSKLTTGGHSAPKGMGRWSYPDQFSKHGMIWWGTKPATKQQIAVMKRHVVKSWAGMKQGQVMVDEGTLVGLHHPEYKVAGKKSNMGGRGSETYKHQKLPSGVQMPLPKYKKRGMWYKNLKGRLVKGWPKYGFHRIDDLAYEGPKPGSPADRLMRDKDGNLRKPIGWDTKNGYWVLDAEINKVVRNFEAFKKAKAKAKPKAKPKAKAKAKKRK